MLDAIPGTWRIAATATATASGGGLISFKTKANRLVAPHSTDAAGDPNTSRFNRFCKRLIYMA